MFCLKFEYSHTEDTCGSYTLHMTAMLMSLPRENTHQLEKMRISRLGKIRHVFRHPSLVERTQFHFSFHLCNLHFLLCVFHDRENRSSSRSWLWVRNLTFLNAYSKNPISFSIFQIAVGLYGSIYQPFAHFRKKKKMFDHLLITFKVHVRRNDSYRRRCYLNVHSNHARSCIIKSPKISRYSHWAVDFPSIFNVIWYERLLDNQ